MVDFISSGIRLGQMCDLSRDVVAGLPVISMLGDCEVFIENYRGILEYSSEYLKVSTKIGNIRVSGSNLVIYHMNQDEILLRGRIGKVSLKGEADERIHNYIVIEISGWERERFVNLCCRRGITLYNCQCVKETIRARITRQDYFKTKEMRRKCHVHIKVLKKHDIEFLFARYRRNYSIIAGFATAFVLMFIASRFVWSIEFDGNYIYTDYAMLRFLNEHGISTGDKVKNIDTESIEKAIKDELSQVTWVNVRIEGNILKVSIDESKADELHSTTNDGNIISGYSGVIEYIITRSGTPKVTVGDEVSEGDILVENTLYVPDDYEENIQQFQTQAQADILIRTQLSWDNEINAVYADKIYTGRKMTTYAISIDKYEISLGFPRHLKEYDKVVNEGNIKIGNLIALPVSVQKITLNEYKENEAEYSEEEAAAILNEKAERFIKHLKENEVQINDYHVNIERSEDKYIAHADIDATVPADFDVRKVETSDE